MKAIYWFIGILAALVLAVALLWGGEIATLSSIESVEGNRYLYQMEYKASYDLDDVIAHDIDESEGDDCMCLTLTLHDSKGDYIVRQCGGSWFENEYGKRIYKPQVSISVTLPNGDVIDDFDKALNLLQHNDKD